MITESLAKLYCPTVELLKNAGEQPIKLLRGVVASWRRGVVASWRRGGVLVE